MVFGLVAGAFPVGGFTVEIVDLTAIAGGYAKFNTASGGGALAVVDPSIAFISGLSVTSKDALGIVVGTKDFGTRTVVNKVVVLNLSGLQMGASFSASGWANGLDEFVTELINQVPVPPTETDEIGLPAGECRATKVQATPWDNAHSYTIATSGTATSSSSKVTGSMESGAGIVETAPDGYATGDAGVNPRFVGLGDNSGGAAKATFALTASARATRTGFPEDGNSVATAYTQLWLFEQSVDRQEWNVVASPLYIIAYPINQPGTDPQSRETPEVFEFTMRTGYRYLGNFYQQAHVSAVRMAGGSADIQTEAASISWCLKS